RCAFTTSAAKICCQVEPQTNQSVPPFRRIRSCHRRRASTVASYSGDRLRLQRFRYRAEVRDALKLDRVNDQKVPVGLEVAHEMPDLLVGTFNGYGHGDAGINRLPLRVALFLCARSRLDLLFRP